MRRVKKSAAVMMAAALMAAMPVTAFAGEAVVSNVPGQTSIDVKTKYQDSSSRPTVYSVDVSWGAMEFTYVESGTQIWNPQTHEYQPQTAASWTASGNTVTLTNHSNAQVQADLSYTSVTGMETVTGTFDNPQLILESAEGKTVEEAPAGTAALSLSGTLPVDMTAFETAGTITVSIQ